MSRKPPARGDCRYPGCKHQINRMKQLYCFDHWYHVPMVMQKELVALWKSKGIAVVVDKLPDAERAILRSLKNGTRILAARRGRENGNAAEGPE